MQLDELLKPAQRAECLYTYASGTPTPFPVKAADGQLQLGCAQLYQIYDYTHTKRTHVVVVACALQPDGGIEWSMWCGDPLLEGSGDDTGMMLATALRKTTSGNVRSRLNRLFARFEPSSPCNFERLQKKGQTCQHCKHLASDIQTYPSLRAALDGMPGLLAGWLGLETAPKGPETGGSWMERFAFNVPVLLEGERGAGKTHEVRSFARRNRYPYLEMAGHESLESYEMLGHMVPTADGMVWKDGKLAQAFRMARTQKVVFSIDELLRIPQRQLSVLLTALSPFEGEYRLSTGRIVAVEDGVGHEEELTCKVENLAIFATTNVGAEYAVDAIDPALEERWMVLRHDTSSAVLREVLRNLLAARGFDKGIAEKLVKFFEKTRDMVRQGNLNRHPTLRTLSRAVDLAHSAEEIPVLLEMQAVQWVERGSDGQPVAEQLELLRGAIQRLVSIPAKRAR